MEDGPLEIRAIQAVGEATGFNRLLLSDGMQPDDGSCDAAVYTEHESSGGPEAGPPLCSICRTKAIRPVGS